MLSGMLIIGQFPFGYSLFINAIIWAGLVAMLLLFLYFRHRNIWVLYLNLYISPHRHLAVAFLAFVAFCIMLILLLGARFGL